MSDKRLVYLVTVKDLMPIPEKDRIVLATFNETAWRTIVAKDDFATGDRAVYFETNSVLPERAEFDFLRKRCYSPKRKGFVVKTMRMAGMYSEGLAMPLRCFQQPDWPDLAALSTNDDLTEPFGVKPVEDESFNFNIPSARPPRSWLAAKWNYLLFKLGFKRSFKSTKQYAFPTHLAYKTDETQVQSLPYVFDSLKGEECDVTVKIDGSSATYAFDGKDIWICTRKIVIFKYHLRKAIRRLAKETIQKEHPLLYVAAKYKIIEELLHLKNQFPGSAVAIQGEVAGPKIQSNRLGLADYELFVFNILIDKRCLQYDEMQKRIDAPLVPFIERRPFEWMSIAEMEEYAKGKYPNGYPREGVVIRVRSHGDKFYPSAMQDMNQILSMKIVAPDFKIRVQGEEQ